MMKNDIIVLSKVSKVYQMGEVQVKALKDVTLNVKKGEFVSIVGKSGSGKSTLVNMIGCLDVPTNGSVFLEGQDISHLGESDLAQIRGRRIGFIFQTFNLMPTLSVYENVALPMIFQGYDDEEIDDKVKSLLEMVELSERSHHKPSELSGGQRQRVAIARALSNSPEVILADEPTGNLDSKTGKQVMDFLYDLNKKSNVTLILVTHDDDLAKWAQRTLVLADGSIVNEVIHPLKVRLNAMKSFDQALQAKTDWNNVRR
ncbi:MAG: ABC transporter ATP-binding protein [Candidatus Woesearchaeota archaeon]